MGPAACMLRTITGVGPGLQVELNGESLLSMNRERERLGGEMSHRRLGLVLRRRLELTPKESCFKYAYNAINISIHWWVGHAPDDCSAVMDFVHEHKLNR